MNSPRPFTDQVRFCRDTYGHRYQDLASLCDGVRSTAWFHGLVNGPRWGVSPPKEEHLPALSKAMDAEPSVLALWIAQEWYGVVPIEQSDRVRALAPKIDSLPAKDVRLVSELIKRLSSDPAMAD